MRRLHEGNALRSGRVSRKATALIPKREVLRRCELAPGTLAALIRAAAFPGPVHNGRWDPEAVDRWVAEARRTEGAAEGDGA